MDLRRQHSQMLRVTRHIRSMSQSERYSQLYDLLTSVPGVGCLTAMVWITEIGDAGRFKKDENLYSYLGLVPGTKSSGDTQRVGRITKRGNKILRTALVQSAWVTIRKAPTMTLAFENLRTRMLPNRAIIRVAKKLAATLRSIQINETYYENQIN